MINELLLVINLIVIFGGVIVFFALFGEWGLICFNVVATIAANIEVLILINAFGMEMTLGNIIFASTFLITDILSEIYGKKESLRAVKMGIAISILFIIISQFWLIFQPSPNDTAAPSIRAIFSNTPRLMIASILVYAICQRFDVWAYHKWWNFTSKKFGDKKRFLWLRNNGSTLISQLVNTVLFTLFAFWGTYTLKIMGSIVISSYVIFIVTSLADTPAIYIARKIAIKKGLYKI